MPHLHTLLFDNGAGKETALLTLEHVRTGYPDAQITVWDNGCGAELKACAERRCHFIEAQYVRLPNITTHYEWLSWVLAQSKDDITIICDPDVIFWDKGPELEEGKIAAGRYIPQFLCDFTKTMTEARLHSSLLIFDTKRLFEVCTRHILQFPEWEPFRPFMFKDHIGQGGTWRRYDTGASLLAVLSPEEVHCFSESELNTYDHLFGGTGCARVVEKLPKEFADLLRETHQWAHNSPELLRGIWKKQQEYFDSRSLESHGI